MSIFQEFSSTNNQAHFGFDISKIFVFDNTFENGLTLLNDTGAVASFPVGTVVGRIGDGGANDGKLVPLRSGATDGSEKPLGILATEASDLAIAGEKNVNVCVGGEVVKERIVLDGSDTLDTKIDQVSIGDAIQGQTMGIKLVKSTELTDYDNE